MKPTYRVIRALRVAGALCVLVLPFVAEAQKKQKLRAENPYTAQSVTVMASNVAS